jgi:hypothetical protein
MRAPTSALRYHPGDRSGDAAVAKIEAALCKRSLGCLGIRLLALDVGFLDGDLQGRAALGLL